MENILDLYHRREAAAHPLVCVDETSKQHLKEIRQPLGVIEGTANRYDTQYARNGVSNLFMIFAPLLGFRHVEVTDKRTSIDFAHICRDLVEQHFPNAEKIILVCDNLNTHILCRVLGSSVSDVEIVHDNTDDAHGKTKYG